MVCGGIALGSLEVVSLVENAGILEDACVNRLKTVGAANVIDNVVEGVRFEQV